MAQEKRDAPMRLYVLDGGVIDIADMDPFSDTGDYRGKPGRLAVSCYLIHHPQGFLLWDAGLGDAIASAPDGVELAPGFVGRVPTPLAAQLRRLGLAFTDIHLFAPSHVHPDHVGNANALARATWILNRREMEWLDQTPTPAGLNPAQMAARQTATVTLIEGDLDVFGDGTVRILQMPGHTPGHQALAVTLEKAGPIILAGDLYHSRHNLEHRCIPVFNTNRAETLASFDRMQRIVANTGARLVLSHAMEDVEALPKFPAFLD